MSFIRTNSVDPRLLLGLLAPTMGLCASCALPPDEAEPVALGEAVQGLTCVQVARGVFGAVEDAEIQEALPAQVNGAPALARVGSSAAATRVQVLLRFELGFVPAGSTVTSADLTFERAGSTGAQTIGVHAVTGLWSEATVSWSSFAAAYDAAPLALVSNGGAGAVGPTTVDVTSLAQGWVDGATPNGGVLLDRSAPTSGGSFTGVRMSESYAAASRPVLSICYEAPTCTDGVQNQGEVGVDCGGPCAPCGCAPGATQACYTGPNGTLGVGACVAGVATCDAFGQFGPCASEVTPAPEDCATPVQEACAPGCGDLVWALELGDFGHDQMASALATDAAGNAVLGGHFSGNIQLPGGFIQGTSSTLLLDGFVLKVSPTGTFVWGRAFGGGTAVQFVEDIAVGPGGVVFVVGIASGTVDFGGGPLVAKNDDIFLAKYAATGTHLWSKLFGDTNTNQEGRRVAVDASGNVFVGADVQGTIDMGGGVLTAAGSQDIVLAKYDPNGNHLWSKMFGDTAGDAVLALATGPLGEVYIGGSHRGAINFGGATFSTGSTSFLGPYAARFDANGNHVWSQQPGTTHTVGLLPLPSGNVVRAGGLGNPSELAELDPLGAVVTSVTESATLWNLRLAPGGSLFGRALSSVQAYDAAYAPMWSKTYPVSTCPVAPDASGSLFVAGDFTGIYDFGSGPFSAGNRRDIYLVKLAQ